MSKQFVVGESADKMIGFLVGLFGFVFGVAGLMAAMYAWARSGCDEASLERRRHATTVSMWGLAGCLCTVLPIMLFVMMTTRTGLFAP